MKTTRFEMMILFALCTAGAGARAESRSSCVSRLIATEAELTQRQDAYYRARSGVGIKPDNETRLLVGRSDEAVLAIHGFTASPWEVSSVAEELHARGHTVLSPLVYGNGANAKLANEIATRDGYQIWTRTLKHHYDLLAACYDRVAVLGLSQGGALAMDLLLQDDAQNARSSKLSSVTLLAPLFRYPSAWVNVVAGLGGLFTSVVSFEDIARLDRSGDFFVPLEFPEYYLEGFPLKAFDQIGKLLKSVDKRSQGLRSPVRSYLVYTESDEMTDWAYARDFQAKHFEKASLKGYAKNRKVPHQITVSTPSYDANPLAREIVDFVEAR